MRSAEIQYLNLLQHILDNGEQRSDRTGTGTLSVFGQQLQIDLRDGFPLLTTKRVPFKAVLSELLWFIEGSGDERRLAEILHGSRDLENKTIWSPNAESTTGSNYTPNYKGDLGRVYGVQWRSWTNNILVREDPLQEPVLHINGDITYFGATVREHRVDQLKELVNKLKNNPTDRRMILSAWNPGEFDQMALPPCHMMSQFYLTNDKVLHCQMYQRSVDTFLGLPFNIASYAALVHILAKEIGATPGKLYLVLGDTHIYLNHIEQVKEQLLREPKDCPVLHIKDGVDIFNLKMDDFHLEGYNPHPPIKGVMAQ